MAEFRQLRAIFSSGKLATSGRFEGHFSLFENDRVSLVEARPAIGPLAERGVTGFRITRHPARGSPQVGLTDGVADAGVHVR